MTEINFAGILKQSLVDYPGQVAAVFFTPGCNFRCPFCHNAQLVINKDKSPAALELEDALLFLEKRKGFLDAVVITGGEPTLHSDLPDALQAFRNLGYLIKLDTNGTNPEMLEQIIADGLVDYVAMDIKAPLEYKKYSRAVGQLDSHQFFSIESAINLLRNAAIQVEFRTTVVPSLHQPEDIVSIARYLKGCAVYTLQQFNPAVTLNPCFQQVAPYTREEMQEMAAHCAPYADKIKIVNL